MKSRITALFLFLLCLALCAGCVTQSAPTQPVPQETAPTAVSSDDLSNAVVVGDGERYYVRAVASRINVLTRSDLPVYSLEEAPQDRMRIIIGTLQELEVEALEPMVPFSGYLMHMYNGDLYVLAYQENWLEDAAMKILKELEHWCVNKTIVIPEDYEYVFAESGSFFPMAFPAFEGATFLSTHDYDNGHGVTAYSDVTRSEFEAYCAKLEAESFTLYAQNEINGNLFMTYHNAAGLMLHTYWIAHSEQVRTVTANTDLLPVMDHSAAEPLCAPLLHQMAGGDEAGYIIRLEDGRFIIVDGGNPTKENADELFTFFKDHAPDPDRIVIAAWYITHAHTDHCGALIEFAKKYASDSSITLQCVMFNPCETAEQMRYCNPTLRKSLDHTLSFYYPNVPVYKPLTGQIYTFGKTTIEILYTMSDFIPDTIVYEPDGKGGDYNVMSMVCVIDIDSTADRKDRWFVMGDITSTACDEMSDRYGDAMKCDFVQVSHHGYSPLPTGLNCRRHGATIEIYDLIDPDIALWPAASDKIEERSVLQINAHFISIVDEVIVSGDGAYTFTIR